MLQLWKVWTYGKVLYSEFEEEVERWIADGILVPWKGEGKYVLPLMAVFQATKKKVRPQNVTIIKRYKDR